MKKVWAVATLLCYAFWVFPQGSSEYIDPSMINIVRDGYGVPHIFADTDAEVAYGLAWAHAEDDFPTIQKTFLASKSMLGLLNGREGAKVDYVVSLLKIRELVEAKYDSDISEDFKDVLEGYCQGFNAYAFSHPKEVLIKRCFPVSPQDVLTYSILQLAIGAGVDQALKTIYDGRVELADFDGEGSNAFAFNSKKTADGNVYFAINTHHPLEGQVAWYEAHLSSKEGWNILGALFPGSPVIFTGITKNLAWTHTVNHPDKLDVYQLELNPENLLQYKVDGQYYNLEERNVKLRIKVPGFNLHMKKKAYWSIYGPTVLTDQGAFAIRTTALMDIRGLEQWYRMNKSQNYHEFRKSLKMEAIPAYNIVYADRFDTIYYISNAKLPKRNPGYDWKGTLPGNTMMTLWNSIYSLEDLPQVLNPPSGFVYNANHSPFKATSKDGYLDETKFDPLMGYETHHNNRSLRVEEILNENEKITFDQFKNIKYDLQLPEHLAFPVNIDSLFMINTKDYPEIKEVSDILKKWDRKATIDNVGATIFSLCFYEIAEIYKKDPSFTVLRYDHAMAILKNINDYLLKHFGKVNVPLGEYQRHERGDKSLPLPGIPDVLAAMYSTPTENGKVKGTLGECYIAIVKFTDKGPEIETVNAFGASNRKGSDHYMDQMELFVNQKTKPMTLNKDIIYRDAEKIYHPETTIKNNLTARLNRKR